jgi:hypothetical protein
VLISWSGELLAGHSRCYQMRRDMTTRSVSLCWNDLLVNRAPSTGTEPIQGSWLISRWFWFCSIPAIAKLCPARLHRLALADGFDVALGVGAPSRSSRVVSARRTVNPGGEMELKKKYNEYVTRGGDLQGPYGHIIGGAK